MEDSAQIASTTVTHTSKGMPHAARRSPYPGAACFQSFAQQRTRSTAAWTVLPGEATRQAATSNEQRSPADQPSSCTRLPQQTLPPSEMLSCRCYASRSLLRPRRNSVGHAHHTKLEFRTNLERPSTRRQACARVSLARPCLPGVPGRTLALPR